VQGKSNLKTFKDVPGFCNFYDLYAHMVSQATTQSHFVEVGALYGHSAAFMVDCMKLRQIRFQFDVIDVWDETGVPELKTPGDRMLTEVIGPDYYENRQDKLYIKFLQYMMETDSLDWMTPIRLPSLTACQLYADKSLDFVFIDSCHDYEAVKADIQAWSKKIRPGGVLAGHDYDWPTVRKAVDELLKPTIARTSWYVNV